MSAYPPPALNTKRPWWRAKPKPRYPRDWRWFVGGIGRALITLGLLIFAFVGYQLWGTGLHFNAEQDKLADVFEDRLTPTTAPVVTAAPTTPPTTSPATSPGSDPAAPTTTRPAPTTAPVTVPVTQPAPKPAPANPQPVKLGDPIAVIKIPSIDLSAYVVAGVRTNDLRAGVGHFPGTPQPGQLGNASLAGHRTSFGAPFGNIDKLKPGDRLTVTTLQGEYTYEIDSEPFIVSPRDVWVIATDRPDEARLTLTSCHPKYTSQKRIIVTAKLVTPESAAPTEPEPFYGSEDVEKAELEDAKVDEPPVTVIDPVTGEPEPIDTPEQPNGELLEQGWFSDSDAYSQVALWGLALVGVALIGWFISRKTRKLIGVTLIAAPFVVVLYFWFVNVNRLLPPNL